MTILKMIIQTHFSRIQVKFVHVFVIAFNGESPRMTFSLKSMIRLFEKMFGNAFWSNAIFEVKYSWLEWKNDVMHAYNTKDYAVSSQYRWSHSQRTWR